MSTMWWRLRLHGESAHRRAIDGAPVATDGPFAEAKEGLVGYWVVDVANEDRAIEIASKIVAFD